MRFLRFRADGAARWGIEEDRSVVPIAGGALPDPSRPEAAIDRGSVEILAPVAPSKIVCVGRNYLAHARELGHDVPEEPLLFLKPPSALIGPGAAIVRPIHMSELVHHEGELAVMMGTKIRRATPEAAMAAVFGYSCANDVTARDLQRKDKVFARSKGFDSFCPVGPVLVGRDEVPDPQALELSVTVDGHLRQRSSTSLMIFPIATLLAYISNVMTLEPGDLILTGTPEGVGPLEAGQVVRVEISCIGALENPVRDD